MKNTKFNLVILSTIAVIIVAGAIFLMRNNTFPKDTTNPQPTAVPSPVESVTPEVSTAQNSSAIREQLRTEFMNNCGKIVSKNVTSVCNCAADYLAAHFNDTQLVKIYLGYRSSGKEPAEVKTAVDSCSSK